MRIGIKKILGKMIGAGIVIITALAFLGLTPKADALTISSEEILMIDGGDKNTTVSILAIDILADFEFGYMNGGAFTEISSDVFFDFTFPGGTIVDFAIRNTTSDVTTAASSGTATMDFWGSIPAENSENPIVSFDYWRGVNIRWTTARAWLPDDILISLSCDSDGIAPLSYTGYDSGHSVPDASIMFLLGPALLILGVIGRKKARK